jgi:hypothetical protein
MFKYLKEHSADLVAVMLTGKLERTDYDSLIPEIEEKISRFGKLNMFWEMVDFEGWDISALWQDVKFDIKHLNDFNRIALVGGKQWEAWISNLIKPFTTAEIRYFDLSEREEAMAWVSKKTLNQEKAV